MHYKRFEAPSFNEALSQIRRELGPNALILSSRTMASDRSEKENSAGLVEITAAVDGERQQRPPIKSGKPKSVQPPQARQTSKELFRSQLMEPASAAVPGGRQGQLAGLGGMDLKSVLSQLGFPPVLLDLFEKFESQGVDTRISLSLLEKIRSILERAQKKGDIKIVLLILRRLLRNMVCTAQPHQEQKKGPVALCLVGPTGVGKTTTIAKLAARYALDQKKKVALATLDTYRIAAVEQLKIYANVMGLPLQVISKSGDIKQLFEDHADADLILMDTAGRSPNNDQHLMDLRASLADDQRLCNYLLISAGAQETDMIRAIERFSLIELKGLVFTKLDECAQFGAMLNVMCRTRLPQVFFTTGQKVPDDIELADVDGALNRLFKAAAETLRS